MQIPLMPEIETFGVFFMGLQKKTKLLGSTFKQMGERMDES